MIKQYTEKQLLEKLKKNGFNGTIPNIDGMVSLKAVYDWAKYDISNYSRWLKSVNVRFVINDGYISLKLAAKILVDSGPRRKNYSDAIIEYAFWLEEEKLKLEKENGRLTQIVSRNMKVFYARNYRINNNNSIVVRVVGSAIKRVFQVESSFLVPHKYNKIIDKFFRDLNFVEDSQLEEWHTQITDANSNRARDQFEVELRNKKLEVDGTVITKNSF